MLVVVTGMRVVLPLETLVDVEMITVSERDVSELAVSASAVVVCLEAAASVELGTFAADVIVDDELEAAAAALGAGVATEEDRLVAIDDEDNAVELI